MLTGCEVFVQFHLRGRNRRRHRCFKVSQVTEPQSEPGLRPTRPAVSVVQAAPKKQNVCLGWQLAFAEAGFEDWG